jgi:hypothetical protein
MEIDSRLKIRRGLCFIVDHLLFLSRLMIVFSRCHLFRLSTISSLPTIPYVTRQKAANFELVRSSLDPRPRITIEIILDIPMRFTKNEQRHLAQSLVALCSSFLPDNFLKPPFQVSVYFDDRDDHERLTRCPRNP